MVAVTALSDVGSLVPEQADADLAPLRTHARFRDVRAYVKGKMPKVVPGQVWADCDPRCEGRTVRVVALRKDGRAVVETVTPRTRPPRTPSEQQRDTTGDFHVIALRRFRPNSRGFRLIAEAPKPTKQTSPAATKSSVVSAGKGAGKRSDTSSTPTPQAPTSPDTTSWPGTVRASNDAVAKEQAMTAQGGWPTDTPLSRAAEQARNSNLRAVEIEALAARLAHGNTVIELDYRAAAALHGLFGLSDALAFLNGRSETDNPVKRYIAQGLGCLLSEAAAYAYSTNKVTQWSARPNMGAPS